MDLSKLTDAERIQWNIERLRKISGGTLDIYHSDHRGFYAVIPCLWGSSKKIQRTLGYTQKEAREAIHKVLELSKTPPQADREIWYKNGRPDENSGPENHCVATWFQMLERFRYSQDTYICGPELSTGRDFKRWMWWSEEARSLVESANYPQLKPEACSIPVRGMKPEATSFSSSRQNDRLEEIKLAFFI